MRWSYWRENPATNRVFKKIFKRLITWFAIVISASRRIVCPFHEIINDNFEKTPVCRKRVELWAYCDQFFEENIYVLCLPKSPKCGYEMLIALSFLRFSDFLFQTFLMQEKVSRNVR